MESQKILYNNYEYYTSLDAIKQLIEKKPHLAQHFLYEDETGEIFRLIIGEENQVENLKKY